MGSLESRIAALERAVPGERPVIMVGVYAIGTTELPEAQGWAWGTGSVMRRCGESDAEMRARACAAAAFPSTGRALILTMLDSNVAETSTESMS